MYTLSDERERADKTGGAALGVAAFSASVKIGPVPLAPRLAPEFDHSHKAVHSVAAVDFGLYFRLVEFLSYCQCTVK